MEIDTIIGLAKPKTALPEPTALLDTAMPEEAFSAFTALLEGVGTDKPSDETATPALPPQISAAMPQEGVLTELPLNASTPGVKAGDASLIVPNQAPEIKATAETASSVASLMPAAIKGDQPPAQVPMSKTIAVPGIAKTDQPPQAALAAPMPSSAAAANPAPQQKLEAAAAPLAFHDPNRQTATMTPLVPPPVAPPQPRVESARTAMAPRIEPAPAAPTTAAPPQTLPAPSFTNLETVMDDTEPLQFGIKIERQSVELPPTIRSAPQAQPVASQISSQLPQLLSKAEKQTVELRLDPPELGRVTIHLTTNDQQVTAHIIADRADTVDLMRRHAELLAATLARAGFSQADLSFQQGKGQNGDGSFQQFQNLEPVSESETLATETPTLSGTDGRLDIRL